MYVTEVIKPNEVAHKTYKQKRELIPSCRIITKKSVQLISVFINLFSNQSRTKRAVEEIAQFVNHIHLEFCIRSNVNDDELFFSVPGVVYTINRHRKRPLSKS